MFKVLFVFTVCVACVINGQFMNREQTQQKLMDQRRTIMQQQQRVQQLQQQLQQQQQQQQQMQQQLQQQRQLLSQAQQQVGDGLSQLGPGASSYGQLQTCSQQQQRQQQQQQQQSNPLDSMVQQFCTTQSPTSPCGDIPLLSDILLCGFGAYGCGLLEKTDNPLGPLFAGPMNSL